VLSRENRDELPNCFVGRRRLGCSLPCAIRLRAQRPDHMAVAKTVLTGRLVNTLSDEVTLLLVIGLTTSNQCPLYSPKADVGYVCWDVRYVPKADIPKRRTAIHWTIALSPPCNGATSSSFCLSGEAFRERLSKMRRISFTDY
jgi:hypothetical protein